MSNERPAGADMYRYYRRLLKDHWLETAICWTVVVPDNGEPLTLAEIGERGSGGASYEIHEKASFEDDYSDEAAWAMLAGQSLTVAFGPLSTEEAGPGEEWLGDPGKTGQQRGSWLWRRILSYRTPTCPALSSPLSILTSMISDVSSSMITAACPACQ